MPQQNNLLLDFNPTAQGGPFAEQLANPFQSQRQPSGYSGKAGDSFMLASRFLEGIQEGKLAKYQREEKQLSQRRTALGTYIEQKMNDPDLPKAAKDEIGKNWNNWLMSTIATAGEGKGQGKGDKPDGIKGHLVNFIKDFAKAQLGGNIPKHGKIAKPEEVMMEIETNLLTNPNYRSNTAVTEETVQQIQQKVQGLGQNPSQQDVLRAVGTDLDKLQVLAPDRYNEIRKNLLGGFQDVPSGVREPVLLQDPQNPQSMIQAEREPRTGGFVEHGTGRPLPAQYNSWIQRPPQFQPHDEFSGMVKVEHPDGTVTYETKKDAHGKEAPTTSLKETAGPDGKRVYTRPGAAVGETAPPPAARAEQTQQHARSRFEKIQDQKNAGERQIEGWYSRAMQAVKMKDAAAAQQLGLNLQGGWDKVASFIEQEKARRYKATQDSYMESIGQANQLYFPGTDAPPDSGSTPESAAESAPAPGAWTAEDVSKFRRRK